MSTPLAFLSPTPGALAGGADAAGGTPTGGSLAGGADAAGETPTGGSLAGGGDAAGGGPVARSPFADVAVAVGGMLGVRGGWEVPESFGDLELERRACGEAVGFADRSAVRKLELSGYPTVVDTGLAERRGDAWWCPLTPTRTLVLGGDPVPDALDVTAAFGALTLVGPAARETFARFCALDLRDQVVPVGGFRPGSVARTPGFILREADERWLVVFGAAYAGYVWETVSDAASRLGGRPVGQWVFDA